MKAKLTIGGVIVTALGTLAARLTGLVTDEQLIAGFVAVVVVIGFTLLAWLWGAALTELQKRMPAHWQAPFRWIRIDRPWTPRTAQLMFEERHGSPAPRDTASLRDRKALFRQAEKARDLIYFASCMNGGITLIISLWLHFQPATPLGRFLTIIYGLGIGGLLLPTIYRVAVHEAWPALRRRWRRAGNAPAGA